MQNVNTIQDTTIIAENSRPFPYKRKSVEQISAYKTCQKLLEYMLKESMYWNYKTFAGNWYSRMEDYVITCGSLIIDAYNTEDLKKKEKFIGQGRTCIEKTILVYRPLIQAFKIDEKSTLILEIVRLKGQLDGWYVHCISEEAKNVKTLKHEQEKISKTIQ